MSALIYGQREVVPKIKKYEADARPSEGVKEVDHFGALAGPQVGRTGFRYGA